MPDIDIDFTDRDSALKLVKHIGASRVDGDKLVKHNTGVYLHEVPVRADVNLCAVPYDQAEEQGYFKIDFLNVSIYKGVRNEEHLIQLMETEPLWDLLQQTEFVDLLFHLNYNSYGIGSSVTLLEIIFISSRLGPHFLHNRRPGFPNQVSLGGADHC